MRYVLSTALALAVLVAWGFDWAIGDRRRASVLTAFLVGTCFVANFVLAKGVIRGGAENLEYVIQFLEGSDPNLPFVIAEPKRFFEISHYAPPELASRLTYLADVELATQWAKTDTPERGLIALKQIAPLRVVSYRRCLESTRSFFV